MKFRKKPVVIEAFMYGLDKIPEWFEPSKFSYVTAANDPESKMPPDVLIKTLEGDMRATYGTWIIKGINGEIYPCHPDIFEKTYELVESE